MMCQCRLINGNTRTSLVRGADSGVVLIDRAARTCGARVMWELSVPSAQFKSETKLLYKLSIFKKGNSTTEC